MRLIATALFLIGCTGIEVAETTPTCTNIIREFTVGVPFTWAVRDDEVNTRMDNGCTLTTITHYILDTDTSGNNNYINTGSLPTGYWERGCGWDACDPFSLPNTNSVSNPIKK